MFVSRSHKKVPIIKDNKRGRKIAKRLANKKVRNSLNVVNGMNYRKIFETYEIYDFISYCTLDEFMKYKHLRRIHKTDEELIQAWRRSFYLK